MEKASANGKSQFHVKHRFNLLLFNYHKTPPSLITIPYQVVAMATEQKNFHRNFNILLCFIIWYKKFSLMWTWLREKKTGV